MKNIIIVGGGIAGLSFAYEALRRKYKVIIVEATSEIGGLAKSIYHHGCFLDVGVHIMYLKDPEVYDKVKEVVPSHQWVKVKRNGKLYLKGRYIDWPLKLSALFQFPPSLAFKILFDQLNKKKYALGDPMSYQDELLKLYGPSLYYSFFDPLTSKFLRTDPKYIHSDWAFASLRAATKIEDKTFSKSHRYHNTNIDSDSRNDFNIFKFLVKSLSENRENEPFYYFKDGIGVLVKEYEKKIRGMGGVILKNSLVDKFILKNKIIEKCVIGKKTYPSDKVVWTGNVYALSKMLNLVKPDLRYLNSKYIYFFLKNCQKDYQVCYYADPAISFIRTSIFSNHSRTIIRNPKIRDVICLEYSFIKRSDLFMDSAKLKKRAIADLIKSGVIEKKSDIESVFELNVPFSYPIMTIDYRDALQKFHKELDPYLNLITFGRQGTFSYNNSDIIIKETLNHPMFKSKL